ncbi:MAG: hypothetical protein HY749_16305 [Gammaproteobacteria bacterium]|nr:hypothetical protein [Gammaproteobacteria bacterium]
MSTSEQQQDDAAAQAAALEKARDEEEQAFNEGFASVMGLGPEPPRAPEPAPKVEDPKPEEGTTEDTREDAKTEADEGAADEPRTLTMDEVTEFITRELDTRDARHAEEIRKLHGKYGSLHGSLKKLRDIPVLTREHLSDLTHEYPEVGELLGKKLPESYTPPELPADAGNDEPAPVTPQVESDDQQERYLDRFCKGWRDKIVSGDWAQWVSTLSPKERDAMEKSDDAIFVADSVERFDKWAKQRAKKAAEQQQRQERLERAAPATTGQSAPNPIEDEEAAMAAGFQSVYGRRAPS